MIRINLLPVREVEQASFRRKETVLSGGLIVLACIAVAAAYLYQGLQISTVDAELKRAEQALERARQQNQEFDKLEQQKKDIENKFQVVQILTSPQRRAASVHVLDDLSMSTPESLWLIDFVENKGAAKISGRAVDNQTIAAFAHNLSRSSYFRNIEIRETVQETATAAEPRRRAARAGSGSVDAPLAPPVTRFLIEARINIPGLQEEGARASTGEEEEQKDGKGPPVRKRPEGRR
jgi:Tfp pilus assembly protein PilN